MPQRHDFDGGPPPGPPIDPAAMAYERDLQSRSKSRGHGGGPPSIPRLDNPARPGLTMADQAALNQASDGPSPCFQAPATPTDPTSRPAPAILPHDLLPENAVRDPDFRDGPGARYASSQPALAFKYGVLRNGRLVSPAELGTGRAGLKPETLRDIKTLQELQHAQGRENASPAEEPAAPSAMPPSPTETGETDRERVKRILDDLDDFDFAALRELLREDPLNNADQRKIIESRLPAIQLRELLMRGYVVQKIPVVPGEFEYELQSSTADDDLELKRILATALPNIDPNSRYFIDRFSLMNAVVGLYSLNKVPLPDHRDKDGDFDEALFWTKLKRVKKLGFHVVSSIWINYQWFDQRVRRACTAVALGNG